MYSHTLVQSCRVFDCFPQQGYNLSIFVDSAQDQRLVTKILPEVADTWKCSASQINQKNPKETISTFRFPQVLQNKIRHQLRIYIYIYIYARIQCLFVDFHMPLNKQSISRTNQVSTPQSCPNNLRSRLTTRTWSKRWGWE